MDIQNKDIRITNIEDREKLIVIKDQDGDRYSFFKTKQDGSKTQAHNQFLYANHNEAFKSGDTARIGFSTTTKEGSYGKPVTYRNVISFLSLDTPVTSTAPEKQSSPVSQVVPVSEEKWERIGKLKALHNLAGRRLSAGASTDVVLTEIPQYMAIAMEIERTVDGQQPTPVSENELVDINVEGIPF